MLARKGLLAVLLLGYPWVSSGQNPQLETKNGRQFATVTFSWVRWTASPPYYSIAIDSAGNATYQSAPQSLEKTGDPYTIEFVASAPVRDRIFGIVQQLNFLNLPSKNSSTLVATRRATRSIKTLAFREGDTDNQITYESSTNPRIRQLTVLFENISNTMEFGRRLADIRLHENQSGENQRMKTELKRMQSMAQQGRLGDLPVIAPVLNQIASVTSASNVVRRRAQAILAYQVAQTQ